MGKQVKKLLCQTYSVYVSDNADKYLKHFFPVMYCLKLIFPNIVRKRKVYPFISLLLRLNWIMDYRIIENKGKTKTIKRKTVWFAP